MARSPGTRTHHARSRARIPGSLWNPSAPIWIRDSPPLPRERFPTRPVGTYRLNRFRICPATHRSVKAPFLIYFWLCRCYISLFYLIKKRTECTVRLWSFILNERPLRVFSYTLHLRHSNYAKVRSDCQPFFYFFLGFADVFPISLFLTTYGEDPHSESQGGS